MKESQGTGLGHMLDLTVADALDMKAHQHVHQSFVEAHSRLQISHIMLWTTCRLGTAVSGQPRCSGWVTS